MKETLAEGCTVVIERGETLIAGVQDKVPSWAGVVRISTLLVLTLHWASITAQTLEVKLVDGRSGRPMVGAASYVNAWVGTGRKQAIAIPTDWNGVARLRLTRNRGEVKILDNSKNDGSIAMDHPVVDYAESFRLNVPYASCRSGGSDYSWLRSEDFLTEEILQHGYVSPNTCGKATASSMPGQITLFVRALTWREN